MNGPIVVVIGGPNGAGKSTTARSILERAFTVATFVNADTIAGGLSALDPSAQAFAAGRIMLERLHALATGRESFAFETTMASRSLALWLGELKRAGYVVQLVYLWLESAEMAVHRVRRRVEAGGHSVPPETVRRRFERSLRNLRDLYIPLADFWYVYDNSVAEGPILAAYGGANIDSVIVKDDVWNHIRNF